MTRTRRRSPYLFECDGCFQAEINDKCTCLQLKAVRWCVCLLSFRLEERESLHAVDFCERYFVFLDFDDGAYFLSPTDTKICS